MQNAWNFHRNWECDADLCCAVSTFKGKGERKKDKGKGGSKREGKKRSRMRGLNPGPRGS